ncbi:MAG: hypothetical protein ACRDBG_25920 [Waterburya sp.]
MSNTAYTDSSLIPVTEGMCRVKGLDINWTFASEVNKTFNFGQEIVDAENGQPVRLPGKPTFDSLTITTPWTVAAERKIRNWLKSQDACPGKVALTVTIVAVLYVYTNCAVSQHPVSPAFDKNSDQTTARFLTMVIEVSNSSRTETTFTR